MKKATNIKIENEMVSRPYKYIEINGFTLKLNFPEQANEDIKKDLLRSLFSSYINNAKTCQS